jgi:hypothetical protein
MPKTAIAPDDPSLTPRRLPRFPADLTTILILRLLRRRTRPLNVCFWPIATFRCVAEFGRYRGIADIESAAPIARWRGRGSGVLGERLSATVRTTKQGVPFFDSYQTENARPIS